MGKRDSQAGFSLIELLIVVAILGIVAAIAIPSLTQSKKAANEASAIAYIRTWSSAQELYFQKYGYYADADNQLVQEGFIGVDPPDRLGYIFSIDNPPRERYRWWGRAWPRTPGVTGDRYFYIDVMGVIRWSLGKQASPNSPALGQTE